MKQFFIKIKDAFISLFKNGACTKHQTNLFMLTLIIALLFGSLTGWLGGLIAIWLVGSVMELTYWFVPYKDYRFLGKTISLPDYTRVSDVVNANANPNGHDVDLDDCYYIYASTIAFILLYLIRFVVL